MAYHNRRVLLEHTLKTIAKTSYTDFEIVVVDDFSDPEQDPALIETDLPIKVFKLKDAFEKKTWYSNPVIAFNHGFSNSKGDKIIITNPECCWSSDVLTQVDSNLNEENYLVFPTRHTDEPDLPILHSGTEFLPNRKVSSAWAYHGWINHPKHRNKPYHWCSAISRKNLIKINGFDERYAHGWGHDDNDLLHRIKLLGLKLQWEMEHHVFHQWHPPNERTDKTQKINLDIWREAKSSLNYRANPNKNIME